MVEIRPGSVIIINTPDGQTQLPATEDTLDQILQYISSHIPQPFKFNANGELEVATTVDIQAVQIKDANGGIINPMTIEAFATKIPQPIQYDSNGNILINLKDASVGYDSTNDWFKMSVENDNVGLAKDSTLQQTLPRNITQIAGTSLTGRDWSGDFEKLQNLDTQLSTRASESTLSDVKTAAESLDTKLDVLLSQAGQEYLYDSSDAKSVYDRLKEIYAQLDVALSSRASESTLSSILSKLDMTLSELRDALRGINNATLTDLQTLLSNIFSRLNNDSIYYFVEQGEDYVCTVNFTSVASGDSIDILIDLTGVPDGVIPIFEAVTSTLSTAALIHIFKDPTVSDNGNEQLIVNTNANSSNTANTKIYLSPSLSSDGSEIHRIYVPGGAAGGWSDVPFGTLNTIFTKRIQNNQHKFLIRVENISDYTMDYGTIIIRLKEVS